MNGLKDYQRRRLAEVVHFVAQSSAQRSESQVVSVDVGVPAEVLRLGFVFVDTSGIGSAIDLNTATTKRFLSQADAVIFVTGFHSALTAPEIEFLGEVGRHTGKLFLVILESTGAVAPSSQGGASHPGVAWVILSGPLVGCQMGVVFVSVATVKASMLGGWSWVTKVASEDGKPNQRRRSCDGLASHQKRSRSSMRKVEMTI